MTANDDNVVFLPVTGQTQFDRLQKLHRERDRNRAVLVSTPAGGEEDSHAKRVFCGMDFAAGPDISKAFAVTVDAVGHISGVVEIDATLAGTSADAVIIDDPYAETEIEPTGHITVDGEPMDYWLPPGVTAESLSLGASDAHAVCDGASAPLHEKTEG